jgi:hypothetical protein
LCTEHAQEAQNVNLQAAVHYYASQKGKDKDTTNILPLHAELTGRAATHTHKCTNNMHFELGQTRKLE